MDPVSTGPSPTEALVQQTIQTNAAEHAQVRQAAEQQTVEAQPAPQPEGNKGHNFNGYA